MPCLVLDAPPVTEPASKPPRRLKDAAPLVIDKASLLRPGQTPAGVSVPERRGLHDLSHPLPKPSQPTRAPLPGVDYTDDQRQQLALAALRQLLDAGPEDLVDVTALRGIGADAIDRANRPFELKTAGREMPDHVTLTANEAERASTTPGFCLGVVAGLEVGQRTEIVVVVDPLHSLPLHFGLSLTGAGRVEGVRAGQRVAGG